MHSLSYRSTSTTLLSILFVTLIAFTSCQKEKANYPPPSISFITDNGYVYQDTLLALGETFTIGIVAQNLNVNLTNFIVHLESDALETVVDSGMNTASLFYEKTWTKGIQENEKWHFIIRDRDGKSAEISLSIAKSESSDFGPILHQPSVDLGAQNNPAGSFHSLSQGSVYPLDAAYLNQESIDLCYYYDFIDTDENTIASPGANIDGSVYPGEHTLSNWLIRRTTRFKKTALTEDNFYGASHDSLLIASYGQSDGNRKAKNLTKGDIFSFKNEDGRIGLFLVKDISGTDEGHINIAIKIQEN